MSTKSPMQIVWLDQLDFLAASGGGELYKKALYEYLLGQNIHVNYYTPNYFVDALTADVWLFSDLFNQPNMQPRRWFDEQTIDRIINGNKYITMDTGHSTCCFVDYQPCNGVYKGCNGCSASGKRIKWLQNYYNNTNVIGNIFLSPLHHKHTELLIDCKIENSLYMRPPIDCKIFYNNGLERDIDILYVGVVTAAKGFHYLVSEYSHTDKKVVVIGDNLWQQPFPQNFQYIPKVPREELTKYYNRAKNFWAKNAWNESFGLTTSEAALCGANIVWNDNSGAKSWNRDLTDVSFYKDAPNKVWQEIMEKF